MAGLDGAVLTRAAAEFARQYHYFSINQISAFLELAPRIPVTDRTTLAEVVEVAADEIGDGSTTAHSILFERFAQAVGVDPRTLPIGLGRVDRRVAHYVDSLRKAFGSGALARALAAYEFLEESAVHTYGALLDVLNRFLPDEALEFFSVHAALEPSHLARARNLVDAYQLREDEQYQWQRSSLENRWRHFWAGILKQSRQAADGDNGFAVGPAWRSDPAFGALCDHVASDRLLCLTGAGVSVGLPRASGTGTLPSWHRLLIDLSEQIGTPQLTAEDQTDLDAILGEGSPPGSRLMLAAEILRTANPQGFDLAVRDLTAAAPGSFSETHEALAALRPRGFLTFNYDAGHETAARSSNSQRDLLVLLPEDEEAMVGALASGIATPFLLKAHGSGDAAQRPLVLADQSYRELLALRPAYRAFVQHLLTEFHLLVVGFGLSDPDFDDFVLTLRNTYGAHIREGIVLLHRREASTNRHIEVRRRFGLKPLFVDAYDEIPDLLRTAASTPGPEMLETLNSALSAGHQERAAAHRSMQLLGPAGRRVAARWLRTLIADDDEFIASEAAFSLGTLMTLMVLEHERDERDTAKIALVTLIDRETRPDPVARALTVLRSSLDLADMPHIEHWVDRFGRAQWQDHPRLKTYAQYLSVYVPAKFSSDPTGGLEEGHGSGGSAS